MRQRIPAVPFRSAFFGFARLSRDIAEVTDHIAVKNSAAGNAQNSLIAVLQNPLPFRFIVAYCTKFRDAEQCGSGNKPDKRHKERSTQETKSKLMLKQRTSCTI